MLNKSNTLGIWAGLMMLVFLVIPSLSYADWGYRGHEHPHYGLRFHVLPAGHITLWAGGAQYYYHDGLYYSYIGGDYVLVSPPVGAYVEAIPSDFRPVLINGRTYYADNGVYYILTRHRGYKVVAAPVAINQQEIFPVNVPGHGGGYVTVMIKRSGHGFVGPQGEFYPQFPAIAQLKAVYCR